VQAFQPHFITEFENLSHKAVGGGKRRTLGRTEHVGVGVGVGSGSLEKCGIDPNDVYQLSFYIFILGVIRKLNYEQRIMYDF